MNGLEGLQAIAAALDGRMGWIEAETQPTALQETEDRAPRGARLCILETVF
jgi:hypothetical protein